jgi:valyl-tRNA synthetase
MLLSQPRFLQIFSASSVWEWKAQYVDQIKRQRLGANCDWSCERFTFDPGLSRRVREIVVRPHGKLRAMVVQASDPPLTEP